MQDKAIALKFFDVGIKQNFTFISLFQVSIMLYKFFLKIHPAVEGFENKEFL